LIHVARFANSVEAFASSRVGNAYTATGTENNETAACRALKCYTVSTTVGSVDSKTDGNISVNYNDNIEQTYAYCTNVQRAVEAKDLNGTHVFGGTQIVY